MPATLRTCAVCNTEFHGRADAAYCSTACRQKAYRARTRNSMASLNVTLSRDEAIAAYLAAYPELKAHQSEPTSVVVPDGDPVARTHGRGKTASSVEMLRNFEGALSGLAITCRYISVRCRSR